MVIIIIDILNVINFALQIGETYQNTTSYIFFGLVAHHSYAIKYWISFLACW